MIAINEVWQKAFSPPDRRSIIDWAREKVTLPPVLAKSGRFDVSGSRHFIGPLCAIRHDRVRGVRIMAPVRGGKTLIVDVAIPWAVTNDNASVLWVFQDKKIAEEHAEERQMPILKSVPEIRPMLSADRHKTRKADILFANGLPMKLIGPALGGLQSKGFKWVVCDEPWMYRPGVLGNAKARMGDFVKIASNKFIVLSQGGDEEGDWDREYRAGVEFVWRPRCAAPSCRRHMPIEWTLNRPDGTRAGAIFDTIKNEDGTYRADDTAATIRFACPHCGHEHPDSPRTRRDWNDSGDYFNTSTGERFDPENPPSECAFRWHGLIDYPWRELVKIWLAAQEAKHVGNFKPLVIFFQKYCALMRSERTVHDTDLPFARIRMEDTPPDAKSWPGEVMRFLTADRQSEDVYWVTIRAWARGTGESRRLWFGRLYSEAAIEEKRTEFAVPTNCTVVDSGYRPKGDHGVYAACIRYGWIAAKGTDEPFFWHTIKVKRQGVEVSERVMRAWAPPSFGDPGEGTAAQANHDGTPAQKKKKFAPLVRFSSPAMKDRVMALIDRGLWVEPEGDDTSEIEREYRRQMSAEFKRPKINKLTGRKEMVWVCPSGNNHAFDDAAMQVLCATQAGLLPSGIEMTHEKKPATDEEAAARP
jgi:hypothetical protein